MLHIPFAGGKPTHFKVNPFVQGFIISESIFWSGWNIVNPIFSIFVAEKVVGGSIETAAGSATVYMIARVIAELFSGRLLVNASEAKMIIYTIIGILLVGGAYMGFAFAPSIIYIFGFQVLSGIGFGIASPAKYSLFSKHLDRGKESTEWGVYDAVTFSGMAMAAFLGGMVASRYGFQVLFLLSATFIFVGALPFVFFVKKTRSD